MQKRFHNFLVLQSLLRIIYCIEQFKCISRASNCWRSQHFLSKMKNFRVLNSTIFNTIIERWTFFSIFLIFSFKYNYFFIYNFDVFFNWHFLSNQMLLLIVGQMCEIFLVCKQVIQVLVLVLVLFTTSIVFGWSVNAQTAVCRHLNGFCLCLSQHVFVLNLHYVK